MNFENIPKKEDGFNHILEEENISNIMQKILANYPDLNFFKDNQNFIDSLEKIKKEAIEKQKYIPSNEFYKDGIKYKNQFRAEYNYRTGKFIIPKVSTLTNEKVRISKGEMVSCLEWGIDFYIDPETCKNNKDGKKIFNQYMVAWVENKTLDLLNEFILENEIQKNEKRDMLKSLAYQGIKNENKKKFEEMRMGVIAEKTVKSFLTRISLDYPGLEFEILPVNSYQDVELKIDILIKKKGSEKQRGIQVGLQEEKEKGDTSSRRIQFTINKNAKDLALKNHQIEIQGGIILVEMPGENIRKAFEEWKTKAYKNVSTPDRYLSDEIQVELLEKILSGFIETENLDKKIKNAIMSK